ncbi:hypothetical protein [Desulfatiglans anilini]|uniref:hypothetical protein n=1 Tax=Desulfatiglans anilini TaxID=90728 RepID=UPI0012947FDB|nr:hypothetical protein [Desulfatiglans anilini]
MPGIITLRKTHVPGLPLPQQSAKPKQPLPIKKETKHGYGGDLQAAAQANVQMDTEIAKKALSEQENNPIGTCGSDPFAVNLVGFSERKLTAPNPIVKPNSWCRRGPRNSRPQGLPLTASTKGVQ